MQSQRIIVAMSGGVDSSVAAALLKEQGHEVIGITMQLWDYGQGAKSRYDSCCSLSDVNDARIVAHMLGIPHYLVNYEQEFRSGVVDYFADEYSKGRTPNPCVLCNSKLKFDHLMERALELDAQWVATGHYARVEHYDDGRPSELFRAVDERKDQSYFLFNVKPEYLAKALFPLAGYTKPEIREIAARHGLPTHSKKDSQEICFVQGGRYTEFLEKHYPEVTKKTGNIVDRDGKILGKHDGIHLFTVGQRKGLNVFGPTPRFVSAIDADTGNVIVDDLTRLRAEQFMLDDFHTLCAPEKEADGSFAGTIVIRYRSKPLAAAVSRRESGQWQVDLMEPAPWVTPGQAAVFYQGDKVIGGGFIKGRTEYDQSGIGIAPPAVAVSAVQKGESFGHDAAHGS